MEETKNLIKKIFKKIENDIKFIVVNKNVRAEIDVYENSREQKIKEEYEIKIKLKENLSKKRMGEIVDCIPESFSFKSFDWNILTFEKIVKEDDLNGKQ